MDRSARLPWHSKGLLNDRFLSMDFTRICRVEGSRVQWWCKSKKNKKNYGQGERETPIWSYPEHNSGGRSCNAPQWRGWWWAWRCSAPPPRWPPPPCSAPPPEEEGLCRAPSPTDAAKTHRNTVIYQQHRPQSACTPIYKEPPWSLGWWFLFLGPYPASSQWAASAPRRSAAWEGSDTSAAQRGFTSGSRWPIRRKEKLNTANVASAGLLTSLGTPHICSWSCCTERRYIGRRKDTVKGQN